MTEPTTDQAKPQTPTQIRVANEVARRLLLEAKVRAKAAEAAAKVDPPPYGPDYP